VVDGLCVCDVPGLIPGETDADRKGAVMNDHICPPCNGNCNQGKDCPHKPEPADEQLLWILLAFIVFMLLVMVLNTYVSR